MLSYAVTQRRQEIGVRVALGANRGDVLALVVGHGPRLAAVGILVGIAGAFGVTRLVGTLLYSVTPSDPLSLSLVAAFLAVVATVASYVPARRALAVDPIIVRRNDRTIAVRVFQLPSCQVQLDLPFLRAEDSIAQDPGRTSQPHPVIEFVRVRRARRYILRVRPDGTLRVTVPRGGSRREAEQFVRRHQRWIRRERDRVQHEYAPHEWMEGSEILLRGESVRISVIARGGQRVIRYGDREVAVQTAFEIRPSIESDLRELAKNELPARLRALASEHDLSPGAISIRNQRSRWGSCGRNGNIALNFRLVQMPAAVRDYVLLHELMHIRQQNHSRRFWKLVEAVCPAFRDAERWLRTTGKTLF